MGAASKVIPVDRDGLIDEAALDAVLADGPALVAIQQVNNETGVIQPLDRIAPQVRAAGSLLLADCAQSAGKLPLPDADFIAACAHKLGGPPGIGVLLVRDLATLEAVGGQEKGYRRGTQDVPAALRLCRGAGRAGRTTCSGSRSCARAWRTAIRDAGGVVIGEGAPRIATIGAVALPGASSAALLVQLDLAGIAVSAGSACSSGKMKASEVLAAMGVPPEIAGGFIRVSFGPGTERGGRRPLPRRVAADRAAAPRRRRHDLPRLSGDDAGRARGRRGDAPWVAEKFANPHSPSRWGREAEAAIEVARKQVEQAIGLSGGSVAFTGSATEALNWALKGTVEKARAQRPERNRIITLATEHAAVLDTCEWLAAQGHRPHRPAGRARRPARPRRCSSASSTIACCWSRRCWSITRSA